MNYGTLIINVYSGTVANPVGGAQVTILKNDEIINEVKTNENGQTPVVSLETVDKSTLIAHDNYSYEIFSYAYVLGINDIWEKQFADISLKAPDWYIGELPFELKKIEILIKRLAYVATLIPKRER